MSAYNDVMLELWYGHYSLPFVIIVMLLLVLLNRQKLFKMGVSKAMRSWRNSYLHAGLSFVCSRVWLQPLEAAVAIFFLTTVSLIREMLLHIIFHLTRSTYGESDKFTFSLSLVLFQCIINTIFAKIMLHTFMKHGEDSTKQWYYATSGFSYLTAMVSSNMALRHVNYPTQVVGKSCKPIPVMILGVLLGRKRYTLAKYLFVFLIVLGVCLFMYKDKPAVSEDSNAGLIGMGEILLLISLTLDGVTGALQERMRAEHQSKPAHMMYGTNLWSILILTIVVILTGEVWSFMEFVEKYPYVMYNILGFAIMSALGQVFIYLVVSEFGPLLCSIITTTRKFFTVLGSVFLFGNALTGRQWFGTVLVFTGLTLDAVYGKQPKKPPKEES